MYTQRIFIDPIKPDRLLLQKAAAILRQGGLVAFPTETVYGLGANALDEEACRQIYVVKGRPQDNPLIVHVSDREMADKLISRWPKPAEKCLEQFWPGPLTIVLPKSDLVPSRVTGGLETVALRMPSHKVALALIEEAGIPVAAPSGNLSGKPSPTTGDHIWHDLQDKIPIIIDGGPSEVGLESTVLDLTGDIPVILRPGGITREQLEAALGQVEIDKFDEAAKPKAPGMKYRHYAPEGELILVQGERPRVIDKMLSFIAEAKPNKKVAVLCTDEISAYFRDKADLLYVLGSRERPEELGSRLFDGLRFCDLQQVDLILAEGIEEEGVGLAIMNRLEKAAGHRVVLA